MQSIKLTLFLSFTVLVFVKISSSRVKEITHCISLVFFIFLISFCLVSDHDWFA